jgi:hypothetical protein
MRDSSADEERKPGVLANLSRYSNCNDAGEDPQGADEQTLAAEAAEFLFGGFCAVCRESASLGGLRQCCLTVRETHGC